MLHLGQISCQLDVVLSLRLSGYPTRPDLVTDRSQIHGNVADCSMDCLEDPSWLSLEVVVI